MFRSFKQISRAQCSSVFAFAGILHAGVAQSASYPIETSWLDNGLRVVTVAIPRSEYLSVGLMVDDGTLRVPAERQHIPHLVEHLCFVELSVNPSIESHFRQHGGTSEAWTQCFRVGYQFDAPAALGGFILEEIRKQWDEPFTRDRIEREARRVRHETVAHTWHTELMELALNNTDSWPLARSYDDHLRSVDSLTVDDLWQHFERTYVAKRMTLVVAASPQVLRKLEPAVARMASIPEGTSARPAQYGDLSWLAGSLADVGYPGGYFGLHFPMSAAPQLPTSYWLRAAAATYLQDRLALAVPMMYDFDTHYFESQDAEVWIYEPYADLRLDSLAAITAAADSAFRWLASDSAAAWWRSYANEIQDWFGPTVDDPAILVEEVACVASVTPHGKALLDTFPWTVAPAESLHAAYRRAIESAVFFRTVTDGPGGSDEEYWDPLLVQGAWLIAEWQVEHPMATWVVAGLLLALLVLIAMQPPRWDRSVASLRLASVARQRAA